jgi:3-methyladenine DNA glycosylase AlkD
MKNILNICEGRYAQDDILLGVCVPSQRVIAKKYWNDISLKDTEWLLHSKIHESRLISLMILIEKYKKAADIEKTDIVKIYLKNFKYINNWDLVDLSAYKIVGDYWYKNSLEEFWKFAKSEYLWKERISMISTLYFIRQNRFTETLKLAQLFLTHKHDLMHKASGWMLREIGKRDIKTLVAFLDKYSHVMPRTMLRYAIEKLPEKQRKFYLGKKFS